MPSTPKKVLIVTWAFYPGNSPRSHRSTELAKELSRQGHAVAVLTPEHAAQAELEADYGIEFIDLGEPKLPSIPLGWKGRPNLVFRAVRRLLWLLFSYPEIEIAWRVCRRLPADKHYDCVISIAAPHAIHWGMAWRIFRGHKPADIWIADCGDPFMGQENDTFSPAFYFRWVEKMFCRYADWITVPTESAREGYYPEFRHKLAVVPQGFRFEDYAHLRDEGSKGNVPRFAYAGLIIPGRRDPSKLLQHLHEVDKPFEFHVFTKTGDIIRPFSEQDPRIILHDFMPRHALLRELAGMDFLVNIENAGTKQTPSKLIDYWLCDRPVLNIRSFEFDTRIVDQFLAGEYQSAFVIDEPDQYRIENVAKKFLILVNSGNEK